MEVKPVEWRRVTIAEGRFEVSNTGLVRNARTKRIRSQSMRGGYRRVKIEGKLYGVHRLVAEAFHERQHWQDEVNHKDGCKSHNNEWNLEWVNHSGNIKHAYDHKLLKPKRGSANGAAKLTEEKVAEIRGLYATGLHRQVDLAAMFDCSQRNISLIVRKEKWAHV